MLEIDLGLTGNGPFTGTISSPEYGSGSLTDGMQDGSDLTGTVKLDGHTAGFVARLDGPRIIGHIHIAWLPSINFTGTQIA